MNRQACCPTSGPSSWKRTDARSMIRRVPNMRLDRWPTPMMLVAWLLALALPSSLPPSAAAQGKYKESPLLTEQVKAGKLPPVEQRLPNDPLVGPVVENTGQYGGVSRRGFLGPAELNSYGALGKG